MTRAGEPKKPAEFLLLRVDPAGGFHRDAPKVCNMAILRLIVGVGVGIMFHARIAGFHRQPADTRFPLEFGQGTIFAAGLPLPRRRS